MACEEFYDTLIIQNSHASLPPELYAGHSFADWAPQSNQVKPVDLHHRGPKPFSGESLPLRIHSSEHIKTRCCNEMLLCGTNSLMMSRQYCREAHLEHIADGESSHNSGGSLVN